MIAVVEGDPNAQLGAGEKKAPPLGIFFNGLHVDSGGQSLAYFLPGLAPVAGAIDVRVVVFEAMTIDGGIRFVDIEVRSIHHHDLAPRSQLRRRYIVPGLSIVGCQLDIAVIGPDPYCRRSERRGSDRVDDAAPFGLGRIRGSGGVKIRRNGGILTGQVGTYLSPALAAIQGFEEELVAEVKGVAVSL